MDSSRLIKRQIINAQSIITFTDSRCCDYQLRLNSFVRMLKGIYYSRLYNVFSVINTNLRSKCQFLFYGNECEINYLKNIQKIFVQHMFSLLLYA